MGKIRIKKVGFPEEEEKKKKRVKKEAKKTAKVPGLKGGERIKVVEGTIIEGVAEAPKAADTVKEKPKEEKKPIEKKVRGKKYQKATNLIDKTKFYPLDDAIELVKKTSYSSFPETLEAHVSLYPKFLETKGTMVLPHGTGKKVLILAFGENSQNCKADIVGDEKTIAKISQRWVNFDVVLATPQWMPKLAKVAKILGPRGLMPNPKAHTVTEDLKGAVEKFKSGQTRFKTESKNPLIHQIIGRVNWPAKKLRENVLALISAIGQVKIKKLTLTSTMGPGVKVEITSLKV
jgi:large subunit ribosomal protein L1